MTYRTLTIQHAKPAPIVGIVLAFMMTLFEPRTSHADEDLTRLPNLALSTLQMIGSHNSYKKAMPANVMALLKWVEPAVAQGLDYSHIPIEEQLALGLRVFEIDVFHDPEGERYSRPLGRGLHPLTPAFNEWEQAQLDAPGLKVLHIQDIDYQSHCLTFRECLETFRDFSDANPGHLPIFISLNLKTSPIELPGSTTPLPFDKAGYLNLHRDLESTLGLDNLVTPSEVQKDSRSLRERITTVGWPDLSEMRGRFIFLIDEPLKKTAGYLEDFEKHERLLFLSVPSDHDQAAILVMNDPLKAFDDITARVAKGFLVRTRADADTVEARSADDTRMRAAFASGAHFISTDYYVRDERLKSDYRVRFPEGGYARQSPRSEVID
ncbi:MAG: Ca2+-dependent phosphoinositide-specific phospholipase C [Gammaproteobacteria bacterium]